VGTLTIINLAHKNLQKDPNFLKKKDYSKKT
jgi:hypothetical protein